MRNEDGSIYNEIKDKLKNFDVIEHIWQDKFGAKHPFLYCNTSMKNIDVYILPLCSYSNRIEIGFTVDNGGGFKKEDIEKAVEYFKTKSDMDLIGMNPIGGKITSVFIQYPAPFDLDDVVNMFNELTKDEVLKKIFSGN